MKYRKDYDSHHRISLTRKQYWEVFTDYSMIRNGTFLALPLDIFDAFITKSNSPDRSEVTVNALELLLMLTLFCNADQSSQLSLCFQLFDLDGGGSISREEMRAFFDVLISAAFHVRLIEE